MLLNLDTIPASYKKYVKLIEETDVLQALRISGHRAQELVHTLKPEAADHRYAAGKWSVREVLCHVIDAERIFAYRALRFARHDQTPLASFDENSYAPHANAQGRTLKQLANEMTHLRQSTLDLFEGFSPDMLLRKGVASQAEISVMALGFVIAGHETHHLLVLKDRYLKP
ncbi:MAG: DinB family protein [Cyclobacteriaceae bacterium]|jgi:uncharacterized damage-inducible protein DinB|nr:DinB family protein [Cyclobacteriaceae bacterium]